MAGCQSSCQVSLPSSWQIRQLIRAGEIPHLKMGAKEKYVINRSDLDEYMLNAKTRAA
jgi:excisionase family DNA binding protein